MTELKEWLESKGFKIYDNPIASQYNQEKWYAAKRTNCHGQFERRKE